MGKTEQEHREDLVRVCRLVYEKGWVAANDGNVSIRLADERILCTPTAVSKGMVTVGDLIVCDLGGEKVSGQRACTSEIAMHTTIYSLRPDVHAVVHAHPPVATGFAAAGRALDKALLPEVIIQLGAVPLAAYGLPGTAGVVRRHAAIHSALRRPAARKSWLHVLRRRRLAGVFPHGDGGAFRQNYVCGGDAGRRANIAAGRSREAVCGAGALQREFERLHGAGDAAGSRRLRSARTALVFHPTVVRIRFAPTLGM